MTNKKIGLGILVTVLVCGFLLTGCDFFEPFEDNGYTFEFKVDLSGSLISGTFIKIEFINGPNENETVIATEKLNLVRDEMSKAYKVSGFTEKDGDDKRIAGVRLTVRNPDGSEGTLFKWMSAKDRAKIRVWSSGIVYIGLSNGNW